MEGLNTNNLGSHLGVIGILIFVIGILTYPSDGCFVTGQPIIHI